MQRWLQECPRNQEVTTNTGTAGFESTVDGTLSSSGQHQIQTHVRAVLNQFSKLRVRVIPEKEYCSMPGQICMLPGPKHHVLGSSSSGGKS